MIAWLRRVWNRFVHAERAAEESVHEQNRQNVIRLAFTSGKPVYGTYDEKGNFVMKTLDPQTLEEEE